jgi:capsular exopolysaccharide synthesis family protein
MLVGKNNGENLVQHSAVQDDLPVISCGDIPPNPTELLSSKRLEIMLTALKKVYEYIIIDTPPILMVSDALAVAPSTDGCILVSRHQVSYISDIERAINTLKFSKANFLGVVVNDYKALKTSIRGSYKKYYYYNSYGYGYGSTNPEDKDDKEIN